MCLKHKSLAKQIMTERLVQERVSQGMSLLEVMSQQEIFCLNPNFSRGHGSSTKGSQYAGLVVTRIRVSVLFQFGCLNTALDFVSEKQFHSKHFFLQLQTKAADLIFPEVVCLLSQSYELLLQQTAVGTKCTLYSLSAGKYQKLV